MDKLSPIQIPAIVAGASLIIEGLLTIHPAGAFFQLVPIFVSAIAAYYSWVGGYYFLACLYGLGGLLAILAFTSVRILVNLPAVGLFLLIIFMPHVSEGPQHDLFAVIHVPEALVEISAIMLLITLLLLQRLRFPRLYLCSLGILSLTLAVTLSVMLSDFKWIALERGVSFGVGGITLLIGLLLYRYNAARFAGMHERLEDARDATQVKEQHRAEIKKFLLQLEETRKEYRYPPRWLQSACVESGVIGIYEAMVESGEVERGQVGVSAQNLGPRAPVRGDGIKSDPYELLGLRPGASMEEIKEAYSRQLAVFDQSKISALSTELQKIALRMSGAVARAYGALTKT